MAIWDALIFNKDATFIFNCPDFSFWFKHHALTPNEDLYKPSRHLTWSPPLDSIIKVNVDGSSLSNTGRSGFGGLMRNNNGEWLLGFFGFSFITTCLAAELYLILHGLHMAYDVGHKDIIIESYSMEALNLIMSEAQPLHPYAPLISQISQLRCQDWVASFQNTLRQGNECADWLVKHGASSEDVLQVWTVCPSQLHHILLSNANGVARLRL
ncbi:ribonuclease H protein [Trifolium medium]|uniref:Ribonuclease H protein n=1 Tax=Trifolium medium TaxID=97028 RepID=A0A392MKS4_9FABA|nr:ribonuclease H protein [Trifolium medium]